ncbi:PAP2 superfamily [Nakaseomyces glabratus]
MRLGGWFAILSSKLCSDTDVTKLERSLDVRVTLRRLRSYRPTIGDTVHYSFLSMILLYSYFANPLPFIVKTLIAMILMTLFVVPMTSQFFFNALPILTWLILYFTSSHIPNSHRPSISVEVLPAIETILYGDNLSEILAAWQNTILDILAWIPYGLFHFGAPFVVAIVLFIFGPPTVLQGYAFAFGYVNLFGVLFQNIFPAAAPWYKIHYGLQVANYSIKGMPGGLSRIDDLLGVNLYSSGFKNSAVVFGAFPSLHSACATMEALFFSYCFPSLTPLFIFYVWWLWWSTMYLTHHYFVDLTAGSVLAYFIFQYTKYTHLPIVDPNLLFRWSYDSIEFYDVKNNDPLSITNNDIESIPLNTIELDTEEVFNIEREKSRTPELSHAVSSSSLANGRSQTYPNTGNTFKSKTRLSKLVI